MSDQTHLEAALYDSLARFNAVACWDVLRLAQMRGYLAEHLAADPSVRDAARTPARQTTGGIRSALERLVVAADDHEQQQEEITR